MTPDRRAFLAAAAAATFHPNKSLAMTPDISVIELRQYTLRRGRRDELITLFEREFIESQEAVGAHVLGTFRDRDDPDRFVWIRGFADMPARREALEAFYGGPVWRAHREAANATMLDSDNVLLLEPLPPSPELLHPDRGAPGGVVRLSMHNLAGVEPGAFRSFFTAALAPEVAACGGRIGAELVTENAPNNFPRLPVRQGEQLFVWLAKFRDEAAEHEFSERMARISGWRDGAPEAVLPALMRKPEVLRLSPTARSKLG